MSAAELRKAAETLRGLAEAVEARESWSFSPGRDGMVGDPASAALLAFINTMSPGVGLVLADWLDEVAADAKSNDEFDGFDPYSVINGYGYALTLARLINGGAS